MKNKRNVYCEYSFWEYFFQLEEENSIIKNRKKRHLWDNFYLFLENSILYFDKSKKDININTTGGKALIEFYQQRGGASIFFLKENFPNIESISNNDNDYLNSLFLKNTDTNKCKELSQEKGIIVFNIDMIFSAEHVYVNNGAFFTRNNGVNWDYMLNLKSKCPSINYCNSLIIVDRYFLANLNKNTINHNLRPILNAILPDNLDSNICFNICIIAENMCKNIDNKLSMIRNTINNIRKDLNFSLYLYNSNEIHDRTILTNNLFLTVGAGFSIIGEDETSIKFTTASLLFPFLENDEKDNICYLAWLKRILQEEDKCKNKKNIYGDEDTSHHLLDFYYEKPQMPHSTFTLKDNPDLKKLFETFNNSL